MRLRRRLAELEARVTELEAATPIDYTMPPKADIGVAPVEAHGLWRERCADYSHIQLYDVDDDQALPGVYL